MRWCELVSGAIFLGLCAAGCADQAARQFAVTVVDAAELECTGISNSDAFEEQTMKAIAKDLAKVYKEAHETDPPTPVGRRLWVNELTNRVEAWFEPQPGQVVPSDGAFDSPLVVYGGDPQEGFIEGTYEDTVNTDEADELTGRELCGSRVSVRGILSATDESGVLGRVRWTDFNYVESVTSSCAGWVECVRDIKLEGLEVE